MKNCIADDGRIFTTCTDCGAEMTCLTYCLPQADWVQFRCDNEKCGKIIDVKNQKSWEPMPSA